MTLRLGNQVERALKSKKFPDLLGGLKVMKGDTELKLNPKYSSKTLYKKVSNLGYGAHRDFRLNLKKYYPEMKEPGVYQVSYSDENYDIKGQNISIASVSLPDLNSILS